MDKGKEKPTSNRNGLLLEKLDHNYHPANAYDLYNKRTGKSDDEFIEHCNQNMDSLLVFVSIFLYDGLYRVF
jgi:hypothetical protein